MPKNTKNAKLIAAYLADPDTCPKCGGKIEAEDGTPDTNIIFRKTCCTQCGTEYQEVFTLSSVEIK